MAASIFTDDATVTFGYVPPARTSSIVIASPAAIASIGAAPVSIAALQTEPLLPGAGLPTLPELTPARAPVEIDKELPAVAPMAMTPIKASAASAMVVVDPQPSEAMAYDNPASNPDRMADSISERPQGIESLRDAIIEALRANPEIQIALARQDDARYGVHEAWSGYLPKVDMQVALGGELMVPSTGDQTMLRRAEGVVTLNQNIWDFGTTINDIKRARATYRSAQWGTRERIEAISYEISAAYLTMLERTKLIALTESEIAATQKILDMVVIQEDLGLTSSADVSRAKARFQVLQAELIDRRSALAQAEEAYRRLTLHLPGKVVDLPSTNGKLPTNQEDAVALIDTQSPRYAQAKEDRRSLERQKASQTGTFLPKVGVMAQGNWRDDVSGPTGLNRDVRAMVTLSYSFFNGGRDIAVRNRISARLREADYELDRRRREVEQDLRIDFNSLAFAREKIATIESEIVAAEKTADVYRQQFRESRRSVFDLLDSQQILHAARARQYSNQIALQLAEFRVLQKLGGLFDLLSSGEPLPNIVAQSPQQTRSKLD
ncbi:TolC family protein [Novosphingobium sp. AAP83]|uniref:TolC family protein n=1 Tax=Novosphingobium sp. AAP83 TaxID=1523425 RepID=UPI0018D07FF5|nr:TolC family protein [Novosphingobium sp. AAP83]